MPSPGEQDKDIKNRRDLSNSTDSSSNDDRVDESSSDPRVSRGLGLSDRLTEVLVGESDGDLLLQQNGSEERVLQWLQALDMQVIGACRVDERLKPLLKMNMSNNGCGSEDRILARLSQHFEPAEVGILARCFCMPLVSVRVGKVNKQGTLLCPLSIRGNLNLTLLPTSDMRLSFVGDNGQAETLVTLSKKSLCPSVQIGEITEDNSGRTFLVKISDGKIFYFWCSEKSKLLGMELLRKMKDLLESRPSIAELTGINESRLDWFATHLRAYLVGAAIGNSHDSSSGLVVAQDCTSHVSASIEDVQSSISSKTLRSRCGSSLAPKAYSVCQGSLSPRLIPFKEGQPRILSSRTSRDKMKKRGENNLLAVDKFSAVFSTADAVCFSSGDSSESSEATKSCSITTLSILEGLEKLTFPPSGIPISQAPSIIQPIFSPYYCWCPPGVPSMLPNSASPSDSPVPANELPLPSLSTLLPNAPSSLLMPTPPLSLADLPTMDFPALLPDPSSLVPKHSSPQIPTFTPLICDPIVHVPVIDVYSAGQGYLVSAGPAVTTNIPPLHPKLVNPLIPENDSMVEESARETLRVLISGSSPASAQLASVLPAVLANPDQKQGSGRRGIYCASGDVDAIARSTASMGLASLFGTAVMPESSSNVKNLDSQAGDSSSLNDDFRYDEDDSTRCGWKQGQ